MKNKQKNNCEEKMSDNDIVGLVQGGEIKYFDIIIERYEQKLFYYVLRFTNNSDESRDIVQVVFMKTLKHIESFDLEKKFSSWIYRIAHNETMNWFAKNKKNKTISIEEVDCTKDNLELSNTTSTALDEWFQIELRDEMQDAVSQLPESYAQVIKLRYFEDRSYKEISEIMNKSTSSVGTLIRRAKKRLLLIVIESNKF